ncbi:Equilibrative nucleotide transporter 3 [Striga hermonthica]|uniref:Equilibrative nucleotide transporter 3 n=1 Tax=Striga hermonthica TaxID=68872 RepID=A0A9N7R6J1_STRHE|nr:Equilibrative nucleotide transporter 3 [Striga hermonthica]
MTKAIVVCWFLGLGVTLSWNSILTIGDYYYQLYPYYHPARALPLVFQPFALGTLAILAYNEAKIDTRKRNLFGYILFTLSIFGLLLIDLVSSGKGGLGTFIGVCICVAGFGISTAHVEGGVVGELSFMCPQFVQSFFAGVAASGTLTSCLRLITKAAFDKTHNGLRKGVMLFLAITTLFELLCILLYGYAFNNLPIVRYFHKKAVSEGSKTVRSTQIEPVDDPNYERLSNKQLLHENIDYALDLWLIYAVTLSIFPGFLYENTGVHQLRSWYTVVLVAMFNIWDLISRYIPLADFIKLESRKALFMASLLRVLFVPCFYFTAKYGDQGWMITLVSLLGLTNGYLTVCVLTVAPKGYKAPEQNALGNLLVAFLVGGVFTGVCLSWLWIIGHGKF